MEGSPFECTLKFATFNSHSAVTTLPRSKIRTSTQPRALGGCVDVQIFYLGAAVAAEYELKVAIF